MVLIKRYSIKFFLWQLAGSVWPKRRSLYIVLFSKANKYFVFDMTNMYEHLNDALIPPAVIKRNIIIGI